MANNGTHVLVAIRGTNTKSAKSVGNNLNFWQRSVSSNYFPDSGNVRVYSGFYGIFTRMAQPVHDAVASQIVAGTNQVIVMGHSQGASVGELLATYLARSFAGKANVIGRMFASPRTGNVP